MSDLPDRAPPEPTAPARRFGAPAAGGIPRMETVRVTAPDLERRAAIARSHRRLTVGIIGFVVLYVAVAAKLTDATILQPMLPSQALIATNVPKLPPRQSAFAATPAALPMLGHTHRAPIIDRNGEILAISVPMATAYADPRQIADPKHAAEKLARVLPNLDVAAMTARLSSNLQFVYVARDITPEQEIQINDLGIPGIGFRETEVRRYPLGRVAAQVLGNVDRAGHGDMGIEAYFDKRLLSDPKPLRLSLDVRVQAVVRDVLAHAFHEFKPIGAVGIVMNVNTGEVLASVSLPDYNANNFANSTPAERFNRAVQGAYEPGSILKLETLSMALNKGIIHPWDEFDAIHPIHVGRFTITDYEGKHRWLYLPEVLVYSSNLGASHIALAVGGTDQRAWLQRVGMFSRLGIQLPEAGSPMFQPASQWGPATVMTVGFGEGITEPPMQIVRGAATIVNGGLQHQATLLAVPAGTEVPGTQIMKESTSVTMRKMMRLVVADGTGMAANVPGYFVGGKTGTAEKIGANGYHLHVNVSAFICAFPMNAPKYAVYVMLDAPHGTKATGYFSTAGEVSAPAAGEIIARIAPMLGLLPATGAEAQAIDAQLAMALKPQPPPGVAPDVIPYQPTPPNAVGVAPASVPTSPSAYGIAPPTPPNATAIAPPPPPPPPPPGTAGAGQRRADASRAAQTVALR